MVKDYGKIRDSKVEPKSRQVTLLIKPSTYQAIKGISEMQDRSVNAIFNFILEDYVKHHKGGNNNEDK